MPKNDLFRVALFGGFNKVDVQEHVQSLENEIESIKVLHQREKNELMRKLETANESSREEDEKLLKAREELEDLEEKVHLLREAAEEREALLQEELNKKADQTERLQKELEEKTEQAERLSKELEESREQAEQLSKEQGEGSREKAEQLQSQLEESREKAEQLQSQLEESREKAEQLQSRLEESRKKAEQLQSQLEEKEKQAQAAPAGSGQKEKEQEVQAHSGAEAGPAARHEMEKLRLQNNVLLRENSELKKMQAELLKTMEELQSDKEDTLLDYKVISKVLEDAKQNAKIIEDEARRRSDEILAEANREVQKQKEETADRIHAELEDKGIQLIAAKHKIDQYVKEVKRVQEGLYHIYTRMDQMVANMPVRIDDYWRGEHYRLLESQKKLMQDGEEGGKPQGEEEREQAEN